MKTETIKCRERDAQYELWNDTVNSIGERNKKLSGVIASSYLHNTFQYACILISSAIATGTFIKLFQKRKRIESLRLEIESLKTELASAELKVLSAKLNPHFIFNSLNSINQFVCKNEKHLASDFINRFALIMRKTLINSEKGKILLEDDLDLLGLYLDLEAARMDDKFTYVIDVEPRIEVNNTLVPPGIIQPLVENSIWHGLTTLGKDGLIKICIKKENGKLIYLVEDNGVGRIHSREKRNKFQESQGISITKKRIKLLNQLLESNCEFKISDVKKGVSVTVELPFEKAF